MIERVIANIAKKTEPADLLKKVSLFKVSAHRAVAIVIAMKKKVVFPLPNRLWFLFNAKVPRQTDNSIVKEYAISTSQSSRMRSNCL